MMMSTVHALLRPNQFLHSELRADPIQRIKLFTLQSTRHVAFVLVPLLLEGSCLIFHFPVSTSRQASVDRMNELELTGTGMYIDLLVNQIKA